MILSCQQMRALEELAFSSGINPADLMLRAGEGIAQVIRQFHPAPGKLLVFAGKGNNGGDAFVAARHLAETGWEVGVRLASPETELGPLPLRMLLKLRPLCAMLSAEAASAMRPDFILDGLLGIGARGPLRPQIREAARQINTIRRTVSARVVAVDLPSGLDGDSGAPDPDAVRADLTATIGFAKLGLIADSATGHVGRLAVIPLPELNAFIDPATLKSSPKIATATLLQGLLPLRNFDTHKGHYGHAGIVAGSPGFAGAAILCATTCVRAGAGLTTLFATPEIYPVLAAGAPPEVMVLPVAHLTQALETRLDALAIGPGLGLARAEAIRHIVTAFPGPAVVDADALNALAQAPGTLADPAGPRLLTPHPGEMERLWPDSSALSRAEQAKQFVRAHPVTLLLKGARTLVAQAETPHSYNPTGGPALAKGGSGDVLAGACVALMAQGLVPRAAARLAAWLCGRAAEIAALDLRAEEAVLPGEIPPRLGAALRDLRAAVF